MSRILSWTIIFIGAFTLAAQTPVLRQVFDIRAEIGMAYEGRELHAEKTVVIPITGGEVKGDVCGIILPGGADRQKVDTTNNIVKLCAKYQILTSDSTLIHVVNE